MTLQTRQTERQTGRYKDRKTDRQIILTLYANGGGGHPIYVTQCIYLRIKNS